MNKRKFLYYSSLILFIIFLLIYKFIIIPKFIIYENLIISAFLVCFTFYIYMSLGYKKIVNSKNKKKNVYRIIIFLLVYVILMIFLGLLLGFGKSALSFNSLKMFVNIFFPAFIIVCIEILRYIYLTALEKRNYNSILILIVLSIFDILTVINLYKFINIEKIFLFISLVVIPVIIKNMLLNKISYHYGVIPCLIYRFVVELSVIYLPIYPMINNYLSSIISIMFPFLLFVNLSDKTEEENFNKDSRIVRIFNVCLTFLAIILLILLSGITGFKIIAIASGSMEPVLYKGDCVITRNYSSNKSVKKNDIIAYRNDHDVVVVHRIVDISNGKYITKGDHNNDVDYYAVDFKDIKGKVVVRLPYIGFPAIIVGGGSSLYD